MERNAQSEGLHFNPAEVEWSIPEEGLSIRLICDNAPLPPEARDARQQCALALGRMALLCDYLVVNQTALESGGITLEQSFRFLAAHMMDVTSFYKMIVGDLKPTEDLNCPF